MKKLIYIILLLVVVGNLIRIPLTGTTSILIADIILPFILAFGTMDIIQNKRKIPVSAISFPIIFLWIIMGISLLYGVQMLSLGTMEVFTSFLYFLRFIEYSALFFFIPLYFPSEQEKEKLFDTSIYGGIAVAILGYLQYIFYPDFTQMAIKYGWDPHIDRLLSTFYDPNFVGGFLGIIVILILSQLLTNNYDKKQILTKLFWILIILGAIGLTFSRSSYLALVIGLMMIALIRAPWIIVIGILVGSFGIYNSEKMQERIAGAFAFDATSQLRVQSWIESTQPLKHSPFLGVGYNTLKHVQDQLGTAAAGKNSGSGSESSLLTIAVTTGPLGLIIFFWIYFRTWIESFRIQKPYTPASPLQKTLALSLSAIIPLLFVHSWFVNDLFYAFIMTYIFLLFSLFWFSKKQ
ncbi:MAG: O-antigen ligase family protein [Patescibacteria group bacterium]|nr:O-antigen ligase family protein [Patescibacteria group bacterium]